MACQFATCLGEMSWPTSHRYAIAAADRNGYGSMNFAHICKE